MIKIFYYLLFIYSNTNSPHSEMQPFHEIVLLNIQKNKKYIQIET